MKWPLLSVHRDVEVTTSTLVLNVALGVSLSFLLVLRWNFRQLGGSSLLSGADLLRGLATVEPGSDRSLPDRSSSPSAQTV